MLIFVKTSKGGAVRASLGKQPRQAPPAPAFADQNSKCDGRRARTVKLFGFPKIPGPEVGKGDSERVPVYN